MGPGVWQPPCRAARETDCAGLIQILSILSSRVRASWLCISKLAGRGSMGRKQQALGSEDLSPRPCLSTGNAVSALPAAHPL